MKTFDLKSVLVGVLLTMMVVVVMLFATANSTPVAWEYKVVDRVHYGSAFESNINAAAKDGWEVVGVGAAGEDNRFAVMRRAKTVQHPSWWRIWKK